MSMMFRCPHCHARSQIRNSREVSPLLRELLMACLDAECGHTYIVHSEAVRTLSPSAKPDPDVHLPISDRTRNLIAQHSSMTGQIIPHAPPAEEVPIEPERPMQHGADHRIHRCV